jgi:hypothetical protein
MFVDISKGKIDSIFLDLHLKEIETESKAKDILGTAGGKEFLKFWESGPATGAKAHLETNLEDRLVPWLEKVAQHHEGDYLHVVQRPRNLDDDSRTDLVISSVPKNWKPHQGGKPSCLLELKEPMVDLSSNKLQRQLCQYVQEFLSRQLSVKRLPFVLFNGLEYYVGVAKWQGYTKLSVTMNDEPIKCRTR